MKRTGNLFSKLYDYKNLYLSYLKSRKAKRNRGGFIRFELNLESNLLDLQQDLINQTYKVSSYNLFKVYVPKERIIMSLPCRDKIVQHALVENVMEPCFERHFISQNIACRKGKGTHYGIELLGKYMQKQYLESRDEQLGMWDNGGYVLKCDISKFFHSIHHDVLKNQYRRLIKDKKVLWLLDEVVDSTEGNSGIPIGNFTSQYFALLYLSSFDHFVKEKLKIKRYLRYMDDFVLIHPDKEYLKYCLKEIKNYLHDHLRLKLNNKTQIFPIRNGVDFLGFHTYITPSGKIIRKLRQDSKRRMKRKMKFFEKAYQKGLREKEDIETVIHSWVGHAKHGNTYQLRKRLLGRYSFKRGE